MGRNSTVRWIGGSPCAGKTTIAGLLGARRGLRIYHFDRVEMEHFRRRIARGDAKASAFLARTMDERWLLRTPEELSQETIESWSARFPLVLEDLAALDARGGLIAEGPGLFPECVEPHIARPDDAVWLVASREMCARVRGQRPGSAQETSDPQRALGNIVDRDMMLAEHVREEARSRGLRVIEIDGSRPLEEISDEVERWLFGREAT